MHLLLDLGHLCAQKRDGNAPPAYIARDLHGKEEARVSCVAVAKRGSKEEKLSIVLRMEPMVLKSYEAVNGDIRNGDALYINPTAVSHEAYQSKWQGLRAFLLITTDTLSRAPSAAEAAAKQASNDPKESQAA